MEGGFFLLQRFEHIYNGVKIQGIEGDTLWYWLGDKGSPNFSRGAFSKDGNMITGRWQ